MSDNETKNLAELIPMSGAISIKRKKIQKAENKKVICDRESKPM